MPSGGKLWRLAYRFGGKQKLLALGSFPEIGLADARERRAAQKKLLDSGRDPSVERKVSAANTFDALADERIFFRKPPPSFAATPAPAHAPPHKRGEGVG